MSFHLEQLLDPVRRYECEAHDAADREEDMRHHTHSPSRLYAAHIEADPVMPESELRITVHRPGQPDTDLTKRFSDQVEAHLFVIEQFGPGAVWELQPQMGAMS